MLQLRDDGKGPPGSLICLARPFGSCGTATFPEHVFYFVRPKTHEVVCSFRMAKGTSVYYCDPFRPNDAQDPSAGVLGQAVQNVDDVLDEAQRRLYDAAVTNRQFGALYKNFTGGSEWLANHPSQPPQHYMWRADYFGQQHTVETVEAQFTNLPPEQDLHKLSITEMKRDDDISIALPEYRAPGPVNFTLTVVSVAPRILQIDNFLSDIEVDQ